MSASRLRVLFLVEGDAERGLSPAARFRVYQLLPALAREGIECDVRPSRPAKYALGRPAWTRTPLRRRLAPFALVGASAVMALNRLVDIARAGRYDAVVLQRDLLPFRTVRPYLELLLARVNPRLVFDFDDSIFTSQRPADAAPVRASLLRDPDKIGHIVRACRHVTAGNAHLASFARPWNEHVSVVPTVIDTEVYRPRTEPPPDGPVTIGWSGTHANLPYLLRLSGVLQAVAREHPVRLRIINTPHTMTLDFGGLEVRETWWRAGSEVADLQEIDVGLMPLADDEWTRGKCGLKALQYMGCGVPCVLTPVGVNAEIVTHGVDGFAARTDEEWLSALRAIVSDAALRRRMGEAARRTVVERYSVRRWAPELARILREVAGPVASGAAARACGAEL